MKLYFLRHGIAEDIENAKGSDAARALTPKGIERMEISARVMAKLGVKPARLYSSPLVRARQTAEIVARAVGVEVKIEPTVGPGFNPPAVSALIAGLSSADDVMFVGHEPDFSEVISALTGDRWGNLVFRETARNFGPLMATAATTTIAQVDEVVPLGALDPETVVTPGIFVDRVVALGERAWLHGGAFVGGVDIEGRPLGAAATGTEVAQ